MSHSLAKTWTLVSLLIAAALVVSLNCIRPLPDQPLGKQAASVELNDEASVVWDGDEHGGNGKEWSNCNLKEACKSTVRVTPG